MHQLQHMLMNEPANISVQSDANDGVRMLCRLCPYLCWCDCTYVFIGQLLQDSGLPSIVKPEHKNLELSVWSRL